MINVHLQNQLQMAQTVAWFTNPLFGTWEFLPWRTALELRLSEKMYGPRSSRMRAAYLESVQVTQVAQGEGCPPTSLCAFQVFWIPLPMSQQLALLLLQSSPRASLVSTVGLCLCHHHFVFITSFL